MSIAKRQTEFMQAASQTTDIYNFDQLGLYVDLIEEEFNEFANADGLEHSLKESADLIVVLLGFMYSAGIDPDKLMNLVFDNNMLKVKEKPEYDRKGKVKKSQASIAAKAKMMEEIGKLLDEADENAN